MVGNDNITIRSLEYFVYSMEAMPNELFYLFQGNDSTEMKYIFYLLVFQGNNLKTCIVVVFRGLNNAGKQLTSRKCLRA